MFTKHEEINWRFSKQPIDVEINFSFICNSLLFKLDLKICVQDENTDYKIVHNKIQPINNYICGNCKINAILLNFTFT